MKAVFFLKNFLEHFNLRKVANKLKRTRVLFLIKLLIFLNLGKEHEQSKDEYSVYWKIIIQVLVKIAFMINIVKKRLRCWLLNDTHNLQHSSYQNESISFRICFYSY